MFYLLMQAEDENMDQSKLPDVSAILKSNRDDAQIIEKEIAELK